MTQAVFPAPVRHRGAAQFPPLLLPLLLAVLAVLLLAAGPARAAFTNCDDMPSECCYGVWKQDNRVCSSRGSCLSRVCVCYSKFTGTQCEAEKPCNASEGMLCSEHGTCRNSVCWCDGAAGYGGIGCAVAVTPQLLPATLAFGTQAVGTASAPRGTTLGSLAVATTVSSIALSGAAAGDFTLDGGCAAGTGLAAQNTCTVGVRFTPTAPGARNATLSLVTSAAATPLTVALSGSGTVGIENLLADPASAGRLYAGLDGSGVYVSSDGGANWTAAVAQPAHRRVKALAKKSGTPLYAGTMGGGVYRAADGTTAFAACAAQPGNLNVLSLALDAAGRLYAGTEDGVYLSTDGCASWAAISTGLP